VRTRHEADAGPPDISGPWRFLLWMAITYRRILIPDCLFNVSWVGAQSLTPALIGLAVNSGLIGRNQTALIWCGLAILGLGVVQALSAMVVDRLETQVKVRPAYLTMRLVTQHVCDLGESVTRRMSAGDLVTVGVSDVNLIGQALEVGARGFGGCVAIVFVAALMLAASWQVGLLVLVAMPVVLFTTTRLSRTMRTRQADLRARQRDLADQSVDIVRGLRVLRGFGGEQLFADRYREESQRLRLSASRQASASAMLGAATTLLPGLLLTAVVALSASLVLAGRLNAGQMVAFYGYATYLSSPIYRMTFAVSKAMQAHVAAVNITRLLGMTPDIGSETDSAVMPAGPAALADPDSGLVVPVRGFTAVVCSAGDTVMLSNRLGRYADSSTTYGDRLLSTLPLAGVRKEVLVATGDAHLFAGRLRRELDPAGQPENFATDDCLWTAIDAAAARDIIEALPDQLDTSAAAGGREFSGGQQQRLRLVRALMADPYVLILVDPTSAVDALTEATMAGGIARLRQGRATVVFTTSTLLLGRADYVVLVIDGAVAAAGSHQDLMANERYRSIVERGTAAA